MKRTPRFLPFLFVCVLILSLSGCQSGPESDPAPTAKPPVLSRFTRRELGIFDTDIALTGFAQSQEAFDETADQALALLREYNRIFDGYNGYGEMHNLWYINLHAAEAPVEVPEVLYDLLIWCREKWQAGFRQTNIALGSVLKIWHEYRTRGIADPEHAALPTREELAAAAAHTDFDALVLDDRNRTVFFSDSGMQLDLGAVAKGYAADLVLPLLKEKMPSFLLSLGGNVYAGNPPRDGRENWNVGVQDPKADAAAVALGGSDIMDVLAIHDLTAVTSGDYWRYYVVDGQKYHHIIDPATLFPARQMVSVTIVCESSLLADYLSTALFTLSYEEGAQVLEQIGGVDALWMEADGALHATPGMARYSRLMKAAPTPDAGATP